MPYQFRGQHRNEEVLLMARQHPFVLLKPLVISALILLIPLVVYIFIATGYFLAAVVVLSLVVGLFHGVVSWYSWNNSLFLLTSERTVFLEQRGLLSREFGEIGLINIQQVSHEVRGLFHTLLGYGSINIYAGGAQGAFVIPNMPDPYEIQQEIQAAVAGEATE